MYEGNSELGNLPHFQGAFHYFNVQGALEIQRLFISHCSKAQKAPKGA